MSDDLRRRKDRYEREAAEAHGGRRGRPLGRLTRFGAVLPGFGRRRRQPVPSGPPGPAGGAPGWRGGGDPAGVREPRRPRTPSGHGAVSLPEPTGSDAATGVGAGS